MEDIVFRIIRCYIGIYMVQYISHISLSLPLHLCLSVSLSVVQVYTQTLKAAGVPAHVLTAYDPYLSNMVGLVRGNLYYNLMNWYRCLSCLPVGDTSKYMETMMGVKKV